MSTLIPADEERVTTKTTAKNWDHLQPIEDKMHDLLDCNVGLLIRYDFSQALIPREVIAGESNEPYGIYDQDQFISTLDKVYSLLHRPHGAVCHPGRNRAK